MTTMTEAKETPEMKPSPVTMAEIVRRAREAARTGGCTMADAVAAVRAGRDRLPPPEEC